MPRKELVSRREAIKRIALGGLGAAVGGAGILWWLSNLGEGASSSPVGTSGLPIGPEKPQQTTYNGSIEAMRGKPLIDERKYDILVQELALSGFPLLQKTAYDSTILHKHPNNPAELPSWVSEASTPLPITNDQGKTSFAHMGINEDPNPGFLFDMDPTAPPGQGHYLKEGTLGIHLGSPPNLTSNGPIGEALFLAKEHISTVMNVQIVAQFKGWMERTGRELSITDLQGQPLPKDLEEVAGRSIGANALKNNSSDLWKVMDSAPVLMLAFAYDNLDDNGKISRKTATGLGYFEAAIEILAKNQLARETVRELIERWVSGKMFLPPEDMLDRLLVPGVFEAISDLDGRMYKRSLTESRPLALSNNWYQDTGSRLESRV